MDAIIGESYLPRANANRNSTSLLDEASGSDRVGKKSSKSSDRRQPETTYGVSSIQA